MNNHSRWLINDNTVRILEQDIERQILGFERRFAGRHSRDLHSIIGSEPHARFYAVVIKGDLPLKNQPLNFGPAHATLV
jgi:hypothetical protein